MAAEWGVKRLVGGDGTLLEVAREAGDGAFIDGGMTDMWPIMNHETLIVSPVAIQTAEGRVICPEGGFRRVINAGRGVKLDASLANLRRLAHMSISPTSAELHSNFREGYDDATRYMKSCM